MSIKDKPAFPTVLDDGCSWTQGMTLRDYFAAKAMQGILCSGKGIHSDQFMLSRDAYEVADAMLEARSK